MKLQKERDEAVVRVRQEFAKKKEEAAERQRQVENKKIKEGKEKAREEAALKAQKEREEAAERIVQELAKKKEEAAEHQRQAEIKMIKEVDAKVERDGEEILKIMETKIDEVVDEERNINASPEDSEEDAATEENLLLGNAKENFTVLAKDVKESIETRENKGITKVLRDRMGIHKDVTEVLKKEPSNNKGKGNLKDEVLQAKRVIESEEVKRTGKTLNIELEGKKGKIITNLNGVFEGKKKSEYEVESTAGIKLSTKYNKATELDLEKAQRVAEYNYGCKDTHKLVLPPKELTKLIAQNKVGDLVEWEKQLLEEHSLQIAEEVCWDKYGTYGKEADWDKRRADDKEADGKEWRADGKEFD